MTTITSRGASPPPNPPATLWRLPDHLRRFLKGRSARKGSGLSEYVSVVAFMSIGTTASIGAYGEYVRDSYDSSTWEVEREVIVNTGYTSQYKDQKAVSANRVGSLFVLTCQ